MPVALIAVIGAALAYCPDARAGHGSHRSHRPHVSVQFGFGGFNAYVDRGCYGSRSYRSYRAPVYHSPSVHYDRVYHHDYMHWTPGRGAHSHGHYDIVPHFVPGHVDMLHNRHVDVDPRFHH